MAVAFTQTHARFRNDDGSESAATWKAATDTNISIEVGGGNVNVRVRIGASETGTTGATLAESLSFSLNGGAYNQIGTATTGAKVVDSANLTDNAATTQIITSGTFIAGKVDDVDGTCTATASIAQNVVTEHEYMVQLVSSQLSNGNTIDFRATRAGVVFGTYTVTPRISITKIIISPTGIASAEAFGTQDVNAIASPTGIAGAEAFGNITVSIPVQVSNVGNIASAEVGGSPEAQPTASLSGVSGSEASGQASASAVAGLTGISTGESLGAAAAQPVLGASGITSGETAGSPIATPVASISGISSSEAFGAENANASVSPSGISSAQTFGTGTASANVSVSGIASTEAFGTIGTITNVSLYGVVSTEIVDNVVLSTVASPAAIPSGEAFGTPVVTVEGGAINVSNVGAIASAEAFGAPQAQYVVSWTGVVSEEHFGIPSVGAIYTVMNVGAIPSSEMFGTPWLYLATKGNVMPGDVQLYAIRTTESALASIECDDELIWEVRCTVSYPVGNVVRLTARFYDRDNQNLDPTVVACYIRVPGDPLKRLVYGIASEVIRESVGQYYIDVDTSEQVGDYSYKWVSSGVGQAANFIQKFSVSA